jgi:hypothetical protein
LCGFYVGYTGTAVTDYFKRPAHTVGARDHVVRVFFNPDADAF